MTKITSPNDDNVSIAEEIRSTWKERRMMMWELAGNPWGMRQAFITVLWVSERIRTIIFEWRNETNNKDLQIVYINRIWKILELKEKKPWLIRILKHLGASDEEIDDWNRIKQWYINSAVWSSAYGGYRKISPYLGQTKRPDWNN